MQENKKQLEQGLHPAMNHLVPRRQGKFSVSVGKFVLKALGWKLVGQLPEQKKFILAVAPHTSNWDFIVGFSAMLALDLRTHFMGKASIFVWPFKGLLTRMGGIPIYRDKAHGVVQQMVSHCNNSEQFVLGLAPEGTRSKTKEWKSGFIHIAHQADIPVVPVSLHFDSKEVKFQPAMNISADTEQELQRVKQCFDGACAKIKQAV